VKDRTLFPRKYDPKLNACKCQLCDDCVTAAGVAHMIDLGFSFIGRLPKYPRFKAPVDPDPDALDFWRNKPIFTQLTNWRQATPNLSAAYTSLDRYRHDNPQFSPEQQIAFNKAVEAMSEMYYPIMRGSRVLSVDDIIPDFDRQTSPGYPFTLNTTNKGEALDSEYGMAQLRSAMDRLSSDEMIPIFTQSTKAELRKVKKIEQNDLRGFTGCPLDYHGAQLQLFADMNDKLYSNSGSTWSEAGATFQFGGVNRIARKLLEVTDRFHEVDGKAYDGTLFEAGFQAIAEFRISCLRLEDQTAYNVLAVRNCYKWVVHTPFIMPDGMVFMKHNGGPSGQLNTLVDNILFMRIILAFCYFLANPSASVQSLDENVVAINMGDDVVIGITPTLADSFTTEHIETGGKVLGMHFTMPHGSHGAPLDQVEFCSMRFVYNPTYDRWAGVFDAEKIRSSLIWPKKMKKPWIAYSRACAQRLNAYTNKPVFREVEKFLDDLELKYYAYRQSKEWREALALRWPIANIRRHIYGFE